MPAPPDPLLTLANARALLPTSFLDQFDSTSPSYNDEYAGQLAKKLEAVNSEAINLLAAGGALVFPLLDWGEVTRQLVANLLYFELKKLSGLNPDPQAVGDALVIAEADRSREALRQIGLENGSMTDLEIVDSSDDGAAGGEIRAPISDCPRGW